MSRCPRTFATFPQRRAPGVWELPELSDELSSPDAALHLGPMHVVLEAAAMDLVAQEAGIDAVQVEDCHVMFVSRGEVGPFRVSGEATSGSAGRIGCRMSLHDEGNDDRVITSASAVFRPTS